MRATDPLEHGCWEPLKIGVHGTMLVGACLCAAYNLAAFCYRRETHNAVNAAVYLGLAILEVEHVGHHLEELDRG